jgi:SSS family solute:Na+ symporter
MHPIDWAVVAAYLIWVVHDGLKRTTGSDKVEGYFLANRSLPWWAVGLSVMATQLSAITLVGTTGQGYRDGLRFVQFYFGLPLAMLILSVTVVPFFHRANVNLTITVLAIGLPTAIYTMLGGVQAVTWTDVKQMAVIVAGVAAAVVVLVLRLPPEVSVSDALHIAGSTGRLQALDFRFTLTETYTFWSGLIGGLFLMLSYFGCDQSQVQRYLTAKSPQEGRQSLMMSAYVKIPLQALILLTGVLVFTFYLFTRPPMLFNPQHEKEVRASSEGGAYAALEARFNGTFDARHRAALDVESARRRGDDATIAASTAAFNTADAALADVRGEAVALVKRVSGKDEYNDVNYVFPTFVTTQMPIGLVGLIIAAIFAAAMSSIAAELNSLATATIIDFYRRHFKREASATRLGSLIEVVNRFGSFFYGSLLGVFVLAIGTKRATGHGAFVGLLAGMTAVAFVAFSYPQVSFLWHNVVGVVVVTIVGLAVSAFPAGSTRRRSEGDASAP